MNKIKFVKNLRMSQIIIKSQKGQSLDERGIYSIGNNQLKGLIKVTVEQKNTSFKLIYTTTGFVTLKEHLKNIIMSKATFAKLLRSIFSVFQSMQDAIFYQERIIFDINYVLVNPSTQNVYFIYVPIENFEGTGTLRDLLLSIVQNGSFSQSEDSAYIREYVSVLNKKANFSIIDLSDYINTIAQGSIPIGISGIIHIKCPRCNSPIVDNIKFCSYCGASVVGLTGDFRPPQSIKPPVEPPRSNHLRGDSQPIDLMGIPFRPPQLKQSEPMQSSPSPDKPPFPSKNNAPQNKPQYPPQNNIVTNGIQFQPQNIPPFLPQNNIAPIGTQFQPQNIPPFPPQNNIAPIGTQFQSQNIPPFPLQNNIAPIGTQFQPQNIPPFPPQNNIAPIGTQFSPQNIPQYPPQNIAPNIPQYPPQNNISPNGLQYDFDESLKNSNVVDIKKSSNMVNVNNNFIEQPMNIPDENPYFGGTVVLNGNSSNSATAYLIRISTGEKAAIDKPVFTVGRMLGHVDYCVNNNSAVGRQHVKITNSNGRYFICDLNSTNGTYIDGREIPRNIDTEVFSGARVTLANEDFKFIIE